MNEKQFLADFLARTQRLREERGFTQQDMAEALEVPLATYAKWERRSPIRHAYVFRFCGIVGCEIHYLFTGRHRAKPEIVGLPGRLQKHSRN